MQLLPFQQSAADTHKRAFLALHRYISPFERTLQTARNVRVPFHDQVIQTVVDSRIREQEFGNVSTPKVAQGRPGSVLEGNCIATSGPFCCFAVRLFAHCLVAALNRAASRRELC